jgi:hypothetical protein
MRLSLAAALVFALALPLAMAPVSASTVGNVHACTPGFWKNHVDQWEEHGPNNKIGNNFTLPPELSSLANDTFLEALSYKGGPGVLGAARILLKHGVAAFLNSAHDSLEYPFQRYTPGGLLELINDALASLDRDTMLDLKNELDAVANDLDCPL